MINYDLDEGSPSRLRHRAHLRPRDCPVRLMDLDEDAVEQSLKGLPRHGLAITLTSLSASTRRWTASWPASAGSKSRYASPGSVECEYSGEYSAQGWPQVIGVTSAGLL
jgi:hypothetical protein